MDMSLVILIVGAVGLVAGLLLAFFGYKLGRFLLPLCGVALIEGALYVFVYDHLNLNITSTWLFFVGAGLSAYLVLFFFKRFAGFLTGAAGAAVFLLCVIYAFGLGELPLLYPAFFTLCTVAGLLTFVYQRVGVVISTAMLGGFAASFIGLYLYLVGVEPSGIVAYANLLVPFEYFLISKTLLIGGVGLALFAAGLVVQLCWTARLPLLSVFGDASRYARRRNDVADSL